ncbi:GNAT family N-acetyltransferase [Chloroflexia bacterium SDU3-3]|nr:GNAT family N-acetyltransferase [Chloroflexia bacterium SDU3-3]
MSIRPARPEDATTLSAIALASKAHWGYDAAFMAACAAELAISPEQIASRPTFCLWDGDLLAGFATLAPAEGGEVELDALFLAPSHIGAGLGRRLFEHARSAAAALGYRTMIIQADPHAAPFYERMGAALVGTRPSASIPGRTLPLFQIALA